MPAATGFMPTARPPAATSPRSRATQATVLPTPVSVPVTKMPVAAMPLQRLRRSSFTIGRPSGVVFGSPFHAWP